MGILRFPAPGQQIRLDAPPGEIVEDLIGGDSIAARKHNQLLHVVHIEIAHAPGSDQSRAHQRLEAR